MIKYELKTLDINKKINDLDRNKSTLYTTLRIKKIERKNQENDKKKRLRKIYPQDKYTTETGRRELYSEGNQKNQ